MTDAAGRSSRQQLRVHGTAVARGSFAALIRGVSGSGKSDLALRFIAQTGVFADNGTHPHKLVADDQTLLIRSGDAIEVQCPATICGHLEVRGLGIFKMPTVASARLTVLVDLVASEAIERLPDGNEVEQVLDLPIQRVALSPFESSAPLKLALALDRCAALSR